MVRPRPRVRGGWLAQGRPFGQGLAAGWEYRAEAGAGTLVVERIEQMDDLMLLEFSVTAGAQLERLACRAVCLIGGCVSRRLRGLVWGAGRFGEQLLDGHWPGLMGRLAALG